MAIDWTRKPNFARHKDNGFFVVAYPDQPGSYYDEAGNPVSAKLAAEANYNVDADRVEKTRREQIAQAIAEADAQAQAKIAQIKSASGAEVASILKATADANGLYAISDVHGTVLKQGVSFDEAFTAVATAHAIDALALPLVEAELKNDKPTGKFRVTVGPAVLGEKLSRAEAEALALGKIGG